MSRSEDDTKPEPGTDDARSGDSEESRRDREQTRKKNAERMIEQRHGGQQSGGAENT